MTNQVQFPGLDIEVAVNRVAFRILGIDVYWYGIIIVLGIILAVLFGMSQCRRFGVDSDKLVDVIIIGVICAIIGGRLYYVFFSDESYSSFYDIINTRKGGIGIYGAIIGAFLGGALGCKLRKLPLLPTFDLAAMGFLIGQGVGRWANFVNQEAFGDNTSLPWGMISESTRNYLTAMQSRLEGLGVSVNPDMPVHPTFLYESLWCALGFLLLFLYRKHRKFNGEITLFYVIWYGLGRAFIEGLRTDPLTISNTGVRVSQLLAVASVAMALAAWVVCRVMTRGKPLQVPQVPDRLLHVKLATEDGPKVVMVPWPANTREPSKAERLRLARELLEKQAEEGEQADKEETAEGEQEQAAETEAETAADKTAPAEPAAETGAEAAEQEEPNEEEAAPAAEEPEAPDASEKAADGKEPPEAENPREEEEPAETGGETKE